MVAYTFPSYPALDPTSETLVRGASGQVYDINDTAGTTPLSITDLNGLPLSEVKTTEQGVTAPFRVENKPEVIWRSGPYAIPLSAPKAMRDAAEAAVVAAQASAAAATSLATGVVRTINNTPPDASGNVSVAGAGGASDHGALGGLGDDDHPQYLTEARSNALHYTKGQVDTAVNNAASANSSADRNRANHTGAQAISTITGLQAILDGLGGTAVNSVNGLSGTVVVSVSNLDGTGSVGRTVMGATSTAAALSAIGAAASTHTHSATAISDSTSHGRGVLTAPTQAAARDAIGAGTSSLAIGTTATTAMRGNAIVPNPSSIAGLPDGTLIARYTV